MSQTAGPWTAKQIHDSVAKIAEQPIYAGTRRASLLGRLFHFLWDKLGDLLDLVRDTVDPRILLFAGIGVVVIVVVARIVVAQRITDAQGRHRSRHGTRLDGRTDYWSLARDEAAAGRYAEACHLVYAALIDALSRDGLVTYHKSKTSGDYARDLRRSAPSSYGEFRSFARQFDRVIFRESTVGESDYEQLRAYAARAARVSVPA
jgi:uncharacterized protein DUF4129